MMKKLHSNQEYWNQLKENDKVLVKSKDWYDKNAVEELTGLNVPIGPNLFQQWLKTVINSWQFLIL